MNCIYCRRPDPVTGTRVCRFCTDYHAEAWIEYSADCPLDNNRERLLAHADTKCGHHRAHDTILSHAYGPKGLVIVGPTGLMKTRSVWLLLKTWFDQGKRLARFTNNSFAHQVAQHFRDGDGPEWIEQIKAQGGLFMDDVDKQKFTERVGSELFGLIDAMTLMGKPLIITANTEGAEFENRLAPSDGSVNQMGPPLRRRLREFCTCVRVQPIKP